MEYYNVNNVKITEPSSKFDYKVAKNIADNLVASLGPFCEKIFIAGSIRRQKPLVKDIEIVCLPKKIITAPDLWGCGKYEITSGFRNAVRQASDKKVRGSIDGRLTNILLKSGIALDLFLPQHDDFYRQYAIRTGSGDYSRYIITGAWRKNGWCGTSSGLRRTRECERDGTTWVCCTQNPELPPVWQSEEEFFDWLGVKYVNPSERNV